MKDKPNFDAYIISSVSDFDILKKNIPYIKQNIPAERIFIVAKEKPSNDILLNCDFLCENEIFDGLSYNSVAKKIALYGAEKKYTGWYLQQFIKLALSHRCDNQFYLVWDCDTIPLHPLDFFDEKNRPYFNLKREYKERYFKTLSKLLGIKKQKNESFISEHMMFDVDLTKNLIKQIEENKTLSGTSFWEKILCASFSEKADSERNFSEFETYGSFITKFYNKKYVTRKLNTLRYGAEFFGESPNENTLAWCAKTLDTISFEKYSESPHLNISVENCMANNSAVEFLRKTYATDKVLLKRSLFFFNNARTRDLRKKNIIYEMDFIFSHSSQYAFCTPLLNAICKRIRAFRKLRTFIKILTL